jgi:aspartyl-tRNA(Asn)/glutamyl-tRNA(Gln) amidotransferase subunit A
MPAMSIPCGFTTGRLPIGLQLQGRYFDEARLLDVAHRYQQVTDWHWRTPLLQEREETRRNDAAEGVR